MWQLLSQVSSQIEHPVLSGWGGGGGSGVEWNTGDIAQDQWQS